MISIGNDIIDLQLIDRHRSNQPRFYFKIITPAELEWYNGQRIALPFEIYLWLLWSVKESAYKYAKRLQNDLVFSPGKIAVYSAQDGLTGTCTIAEQTLYFQSAITARYIHTIVDTDDSFEGILFGIGHHQDNNASASVRQLLISHLAATGAEPMLSKDASGIPWLNLAGSTLPVSFSHHGLFVAFVLKQL